jgi:hypothetical protein
VDTRRKVVQVHQGQKVIKTLMSTNKPGEMLTPVIPAMREVISGRMAATGENRILYLKNNLKQEGVGVWLK